MIRASAPAKINLCLHVTGQRADGYHLLESLVVFADCGEYIDLHPGTMELEISGPFAHGLNTQDNLITKAAELFGTGAKARLHKCLPVSSGIGGGSSDAAAMLRGLKHMTGEPIPDALSLGADVPMCLAAHPLLANGIGERLTPLPKLPPLWLVLVNPNLAVSTPDVFRALTCKQNSPISKEINTSSAKEFAAFLLEQRNDLERPAREICPPINSVLKAIEAQSPLIARMSGSGATCFGLFEDETSAAQAAKTIGAQRSEWWCVSAPVLAADTPLIS